MKNSLDAAIDAMEPVQKAFSAIPAGHMSHYDRKRLAVAGLIAFLEAEEHANFERFERCVTVSENRHRQFMGGWFVERIAELKDALP